MSGEKIIEGLREALEHAVDAVKSILPDGEKECKPIAEPMIIVPPTTPVPTMPKVSVTSAEDRTVVAKTVWAEARGEGYMGMACVAWVIRNRVEADLGNDGKPDWWGEGYKGVCLKPFQFSCWNDSDPQSKVLNEMKADDPRLSEAYKAADDVMKRRIADPTSGATHYHTVAKPSYAKVWPPEWAPTMKKTGTVQRHVFYRAI